MVLAEHGHAFAGRDFQFAAGTFQFAGEHFQEGGFARAVRADHAVAVAFDEFEVDIVKKYALAELYGNIVH